MLPIYIYEKINCRDYDADGRYGWKHGFFSNKNIKKINEENAIVIIIHRDIFYWLVSMYHKSYCKGLNPEEMSFSQFIRHKYNHYNEEACNIIQLRTQKIKQWNNAKINNKYIVNYENMNDDLKKLPFIKGNKWKVIENYTLHGVIYKKKFIKKDISKIIKYYTIDDINFILKNIDIDLESSINYSYDYLNQYFKLK